MNMVVTPIIGTLEPESVCTSCELTSGRASAGPLTLLFPMQPMQSNMYVGSIASFMASRRLSRFVP